MIRYNVKRIKAEGRIQDNSVCQCIYSSPFFPKYNAMSKPTINWVPRPAYFCHELFADINQRIVCSLAIAKVKCLTVVGSPQTKPFLTLLSIAP